MLVQAYDVRGGVLDLDDNTQHIVRSIKYGTYQPATGYASSFPPTRYAYSARNANTHWYATRSVAFHIAAKQL